jgi:ABC-2 type transport system permease protein
MATNEVLLRVEERGWRHGLGNLLRAEMGSWWRTSAWWVQSLIWVGVINMILASFVWNPEEAADMAGIGMFALFAGLFPPIAIIIILQDAIVGEKESGTAAWVLSKPVSRTAFIVSKLIANSTGVLATMLLFPGLGAYLQISLAGGAWIPPLNFLGGLAILALYQLFFLTLTLMLGTLFSHRAPVIGIPLALAFGQSMILNMIPQLGAVMPWTLIASPDEQVPSITEAIITGASPPSLLPVGSILILILIFIGVAIWRFEQEEF